MTDARTEVCIVGGGIAGGALATALARAGRDVVVLERQTGYEDRVRGEFMQPWGVAEVQRLGLLDVLLAAGGNLLRRLIPYGEERTPEQALAEAGPFDQVIPGVPGALAFGHPAGCSALTAAAEAAGARIHRGVRGVEVEAGADPAISFGQDGARQRVRARLVVGADGRESTVRRQLGLGLAETPPAMFGSGLLVDGLKAWPFDDATIGAEDDRMFFVFPQGGGRARLYLMYPVALRERIAGREKAQRFVEWFDIRSIPDGLLEGMTPAGPCAAYPMHDTWLAQPAVPGAVLVGDAAGYNDPVLGQGLSLAMRDVRDVVEVMSDGDWSARAFEGYARARTERLRRMRFTAQVFSAVHWVAAGSRERRAQVRARMTADPSLGAHSAATVIGPDALPADAFDDRVFERLLAP